MTVDKARARNSLRRYRQDLIFVERQARELERMSNEIDAVMDGVDRHGLETLYADYIASFVKLYRDILMVENIISTIPQPFKNVLTLMYLDGLSLTDTAHELGYNYAYTSKLNTTGLTIYAEKLKKVIQLKRGKHHTLTIKNQFAASNLCPEALSVISDRE